MLDVLSRIALRFQEAEVIWALGASFLLYYHGLVEAPHDIDLMVERGSIEKADAILRQLGDKQEPEQNPLYGTDYFYEYVIDGVEVDVMAGLQIRHREGCFVYRFDAKAVDGSWEQGRFRWERRRTGMCFISSCRVVRQKRTPSTIIFNAAESSAEIC